MWVDSLKDHAHLLIHPDLLVAHALYQLLPCLQPREKYMRFRQRTPGTAAAIKEHDTGFQQQLDCLLGSPSFPDSEIRTKQTRHADMP